VSHVPYFLETLTRKLYRKKIPENALIVTQVTRDGRTWTRWTPFPVIPESLTRKLYRKKIPEIVKMVSMVPGREIGLDKVDKRYSISGIFYEKSVQKKDPGNRDSFVQLVQISRMSSAPSGTVQSPKRSGTRPVRCLFLFRSIVKRHAMTGSGLGRYARAGQPRGFTFQHRSTFLKYVMRTAFDTRFSINHYGQIKYLSWTRSLSSGEFLNCLYLLQT